MTRTGRPDATVRSAGIAAQKLRYLEVLLRSPWKVMLGPGMPASPASGLTVLVPNATSFVVQKLLIHPQRQGRKKAQDLLYIHDTLELFAASLGDLNDLWVGSVRPAMREKTAKRAEAAAHDLFARMTDSIREAAEMRTDRRLVAANVRAACEYGLSEMLKRSR